MGKYKTLAKNSAFVLIGNIGSKAIAFLMLPFYTSYLSVEDYGTADLVSVYVALILPFVTCSISESIFVFPANRNKSDQKAYFTSGINFAIMMLLFFAIILAMSGIVFYDSTNVFFQYKWFVFVSIAISYCQTYLQQFCMALNKMFIFSFTGIILTFSIALFGIIMVPMYGLIGYLISIILANMITSAFTLVATKSYHYYNLRATSFMKLKEMLNFSVPLIPNALMWWIIGALNKVTMQTYVGVYFIGLYAIADKIPSILSALFNSLTNAWKVSVLNEYGKDTFCAFYNNVAKAVITTVALGAALLGIFSEPIITIATRESFHAAWIYSPIMVFGFLFQASGGIVDSIFAAEKKGKYYLYTSLLGATVCILFNFTLIPLYGIWGAIISFASSHFTIAVSRLYFAEKYVRLKEKKLILLYLFIVLLNNILLVSFHCYLLSIVTVIVVMMLYLYINKSNMSFILSIIKRK